MPSMWNGSPSICLRVKVSRFISYPVAPNSGRASCQAGAMILLGFLRELGSGRRSASNHSVSEICHKSSWGLRKCVSKRRAFFTSVICR